MENQKEKEKRYEQPTLEPLDVVGRGNNPEYCTSGSSAEHCVSSGGAPFKT
jgi:hypothetical protein